MSSPLTIVVFARAPVPGRCKTRLAASFGARAAARLHRQLLWRTLATVRTVPAARLELWCAPDAGHGDFHALRRRHGLRLRRQASGDLGRRMAIALASSLAEGSKKVLLLGSDCAALRCADLLQAASALDDADCVLQPTEDGGYALIGARRFAVGLLRGIAWSSGRECRQTQAALQRQGLRCALTPGTWDVDRPADVRRARRLGLLPRLAV